jgi:hypothetical protein
VSQHRIWISDEEAKQDPLDVARRELGRPFLGRPSVWLDRIIDRAKLERDDWGPYLAVEWRTKA